MNKYIWLLIILLPTFFLSYWLVSKPTFPLLYSLPTTNFATPIPVTPDEQNESQLISILFTGDVMLDRNIRLAATKHGYDYLMDEPLKNLLQQNDYVVINLEGPITQNNSVSVGSEVGSTRNFLFTFDPSSTAFLKNNNIQIVNLGNNHILNFGQEGLSETYSNLQQANIEYFGYTGKNIDPSFFTHIETIDTFTIGFVNYNQFISGGETQILQDIAALKEQVDFLIVYTHWGNEYVRENTVLINLAHQFVDAGAHLVIGSHPHVITGKEIYKDAPIYYSLGNFIFDQYFEKAVQQGLLVKAEIDPITKSVNTTEYGVYIDKSGQTRLDNTPTVPITD